MVRGGLLAITLKMSEKELAVILILLHPGELLPELLGLGSQGVLVHIADRHDIAAAVRGVVAVAVAFAADADAGDIDAIVGSQHAPDIREREGSRAPGQNGAAQELTSSEGISCKQVG